MRLQNCKYIVASGTTGRYAGCDLLSHPEMNELHCLWNCGFYSNQFQVFCSLLILMRHGIVPDKIDYSMGFRHFKKDPNQNIYPLFHQINETQELNLYKEVPLPDANKKQFDVYDFDSYNKIIKRFFNPSKIIEERKKYLTDKYQINFNKTISVLYRGTDKGTELKIASPEQYLSIAKKLLDKNPDFKVLLQTDQTQVIEYFYSNLDNILIVFEETPSTNSNRVIWSIMEQNGEDSIDWSQWFDAALRCVSACKYVINHTGNVGMFMNLYRGNTTGVYQFNENGACYE
jgi:hypothetical protein